MPDFPIASHKCYQSSNIAEIINSHNSNTTMMHAWYKTDYSYRGVAYGLYKGTWPTKFLAKFNFHN